MKDVLRRKFDRMIENGTPITQAADIIKFLVVATHVSSFSERPEDETMQHKPAGFDEQLKQLQEKGNQTEQ
jgi:hypothetical protein